jgi:hypothetical protein
MITPVFCGTARVVLAILAVQLATVAQAADATLNRAARFRIGSEVVNENVLPFTATIGGFGNSLIADGAGFEPVVFRNRLTAVADAPDRIVTQPLALTRYDTLAGDFFDGATVDVYRIENGRFRLVREDRVAAGGGHAAGWIRAMDDGLVVPAGTQRYAFRWDNWNRPNAAYFFSVQAVDRAGNLSVPSPAFAITSPGKPSTINPANTTQRFKPAKPLLPMTASTRAPDAPAALRGQLGADGILVLEWDAAKTPDLAGYVVLRADRPPERHDGYYLQLEKQAAGPAQYIRTGDMIILSRKLYSVSRQRDLTQRVWGAAGEHSRLLPGLVGFFPDENPDKHWELARHEPATPVEEAGETYLKLRLGTGVRESLVTFNHGGTGQAFYEVLENTPYIGEVWLRRDGAGSVQFRLAGFYERGPNPIAPVVFEVGRNWKKFVFRFTPPAVMSGEGVAGMLLEFTGPGTFDVDNFRIYRADTPFLDFPPRDLQALKDTGLSALRTHGTIKTGVRSYDMEQLTNPGGVISGTARLNTLPQMLRNMQQVVANPWLQIEYHMAPREWLGLLEYLAAPYDPRKDSPQAKPWAFKRHAQGRERPWTDQFPKVYFELGNETWNRLFQPWVFDTMTDAINGKSYSPGQVYGMYQEFVIATLRSSPYWKSAGLDRKFVFVLGGWASNIGYSRDAAINSPSSDLLAIAAYNGGWDEGEGPPLAGASGLYDTLAQTGQAAMPTADRYAKELPLLIARGAARGLKLATYEAGPGYALNGLNNNKVSKEQNLAQEQVMKSLAAGTATLDAFLARAYRGFDLQNFFAFDRGALWRSHAKWYHGGQAYPSWKTIELFNAHANGAMLGVETLAVPSADIKGFSRRESITGSPLVAAYATQKGDRLSVFVLSRRVSGYPLPDDDGYTPVSVELPFDTARSITLYRMSGPPQANNLIADNVKIEKLPIAGSALAGKRLTVNAETGGDQRGLPAASTFLYVFEGISGGLAGKSPAKK